MKIWSWNDNPGGWVEVGEGTQADVERRYATAIVQEIDGAAFIALPAGQKPKGGPRKLGVTVTKGPPRAKHGPAADGFDPYAEEAAWLDRKMLAREELERQGLVEPLSKIELRFGQRTPRGEHSITQGQLAEISEQERATPVFGLRDSLNARIRAEFETFYYRAAQSNSEATRRLVGATKGVLDYTELLQREAAGTPFEATMRAISETIYATIGSELELDPPKDET